MIVLLEYNNTVYLINFIFNVSQGAGIESDKSPILCSTCELQISW